MAALARDAPGLGVLTAANSVAACGESERAIDPFWAPLCETLAAVWRGEAAAHMGQLNRRGIRLTVVPLPN